MSRDSKALPIEAILQAWLDDADVTLFCGQWGQGGVMELLPAGGAKLSGPRYDPPFDRLRELRLDDGAHHVHLDLGRLTHAWYVMTASVCYGFRPSFELRLTGVDGEPLVSFGLGLALRHPYAKGRLRTESVSRYFRRAAEHLERFPESVSLVCDRSGAPHGAQSDWDAIEPFLAAMESPRA